MIPYVANTFLSTAADTKRLRYHCDACDTDSNAVVSAVSRGYAEAPYFVGERSAAQEADASAVAGLPAALQRTLGLARCPKCHARDKREVRSATVSALLSGFVAWIWFTLPGLVAAIIGVAVAVDAPSLKSLGIAIACVVLGLAPLALAAKLRYGRAVREADSLVVWD
jgi:hypothetical protein